MELAFLLINVYTHLLLTIQWHTCEGQPNQNTIFNDVSQMKCVLLVDRIEQLSSLHVDSVFKSRICRREKVVEEVVRFCCSLLSYLSTTSTWDVCPWSHLMIFLYFITAVVWLWRKEDLTWIIKKLKGKSILRNKKQELS